MLAMAIRPQDAQPVLTDADKKVVDDLETWLDGKDPEKPSPLLMRTEATVKVSLPGVSFAVREELARRYRLARWHVYGPGKDAEDKDDPADVLRFVQP